MRYTRIVRIVMAVLVLSTALPQWTFAQNLGGDARAIALGGAGDASNIASKVIGEQKTYTSIPIPFGLFQVFKNRKFFESSNADFDPVRAIEYAADPLHVTLNRNSDVAGNRFVNSLVNGQVSRDLNAYRGFKPSPEINATGLISPSFGKTFTVAGDKSAGTSHGIYVGAGPYISLGTSLRFDQNLINILASSTNVYRPNTNFLIGDDTTGQAAYAITGGYRGRLPLSGALEKFGSRQSGENREGIHIVANYHYLRGIHYDTADMQLRFDTDPNGLLIVVPTTTPIIVNRTTSKSGNGFALDFATAIVTEHWDIGGGVEGVGNRITWKDLGSHRYTLRSLSSSLDFVTASIAPPSTEQRVTLPVRYSGSGGYHTGRWSVATEAGRSLQGFNFGSGAEYMVGPLAFRGGGRYSRKVWNGATGIGLTIFKGFGIDAAAFQTSTNIEQDRRISFALSLRIGGIGQ